MAIDSNNKFVNPNSRNNKTLIPIIILREREVHFNLKKLNRKVQLIVENFENPVWIVRICLNILMPFYINYFLKILEDEFLKSESKGFFINLHATMVSSFLLTVTYVTKVCCFLLKNYLRNKVA